MKNLNKKNRRRIRRTLERSDLRIKFEAERYRANIAEASLARMKSDVIIFGPYVGINLIDDSVVSAFLREDPPQWNELETKFDRLTSRVSKL